MRRRAQIWLRATAGGDAACSEFAGGRLEAAPVSGARAGGNAAAVWQHCLRCVPSMTIDLEVEVLWEVDRDDPSEP